MSTPADVDWIARPPRRVTTLSGRAWERLPARVRRALPDSTAFILHILLAGWVTARFWKDLSRVSPIRPADQAAFERLLAHVAHAVRHLENPLAGLPAQVPGGGALVPQISALGITLPLSPVTLAFGPGAAYASSITLALAATAIVTYHLLSRYLVTSRAAAFVGAAVFAFGPGIMWHANGQPYFLANFLVPLIVLRAVRLTAGRPVRNGILLGLLLTWQALINTEVLALTALGGAVAALYYALQGEAAPGRSRFARIWPGWGAARSAVVGLAVALGTALVLLAYPLWYRFAGDPLHHVVPVPPADHGEDLTTFVLFWRDSLAGNLSAAKSIGSIEQNTWFGWPLVILALVSVALLWRVSVAVRVVTLTAVVFGVFSLGSVIRVNGQPTGVPGPWWPFSKVPGFEDIAPTHLALVLLPCLAVLLAIACDRLPSTDTAVSHGLSFKRLWIILATAALVATAPKPLLANGNLGDIPTFITAGTWRQYVSPGETLVPVPSSVAAIDAPVMQAAGRMEFDVPPPYRGAPAPDGLTTEVAGSPTAALLKSVAISGDAPDVNAKMVNEAYADLRSWHASILVLVAGGKLEDLMRDTVTHLLGVYPSWIDGAWVWDVRSITKAGAPS
ncbi:MAG: hypothetical protein AUI14_15315 [Actinobacteria bacterium 13_2_20CM_2_71_6]|nr:MAG: hypothetical protein AUI14_15315 [Actinobacteria bacterium 13_2_20CM_2_71_6]